jgi:putative endonuclease
VRRVVDMKEKRGYVYMLMNNMNTVIYVGVTSNLKERIWQHRNRLAEGFTKRYHVTKFVYFEVFDSVTDAIAREKQLKAGPRRAKERLVRNFNPELRDLFDEI